MSRSLGFRFLVVGLLALLMFIPLFLAGEVIDSRASYNRQTVRDVGGEWGGPQSLAGPMLIIPVEAPVTRVDDTRPKRTITDIETGETRLEPVMVTRIERVSPVHIFPERFDVTLDSRTSERKRGIFRVPVYSAEARIRTDFVLPEAADILRPDETLLWDQAEYHLLLSTNRSLRGTAELTADGTPLRLEPTATGSTGGLFAVVGDPRGTDGFDLTLGFNGAQEVQLSPVGRSSQVTMTGDWPHPSFIGAFLPNSYEVSDAGFSAEWNVPHLARPLPQISREGQFSAAYRQIFGVRFFQPNDFYQKAYRAARYGILFIALTFVTVLLVENRTERPAHPVQYILIGLAQSIFVLLMVAYAEQIGFGPAYGLSAGATIVLLTMFGAFGLKLGARTLVLGLTLVLLYGVLYLILRSADYALLAGSTLAFAALAGTMYATRNEDWYGPETGQSGRRGLFGPKAPAKVVPAKPDDTPPVPTGPT